MPDKEKTNGGKGKGSYAFDANDLLGGILSETENEAAVEEERLKSELQQRQTAQERRQEQEAEQRRRESEAALEAERSRQEAARARRTAVMQTVEQLEAETASGSLESIEPDLQGRRHSGPYDYAAAVRNQSYIHPAVQQKRPVWMLAAMVALLVLLIGGGTTVAIVMLGGPSLDPNSYPKSTLNLEGVTNNGAMTVAVRMAPTPEPVLPVADATEQPPVNDRGSDRRGRGDRRDRDRGETSSEGNGAPLDISLDGPNIFDRGSE